MAIVYTYPQTTDLQSNDLFIVSKMDDVTRQTRSISAANLANYIAPLIPGAGTVTGDGTTNHLVKFVDGPNGVIGDAPIIDTPGGEVQVNADLLVNGFFTAEQQASIGDELTMVNGGPITLDDPVGPPAGANVALRFISDDFVIKRTGLGNITLERPSGNVIINAENTNGGSFASFQFGTGGSIKGNSPASGPTGDFEFRVQDGGFYSKTFKFRERVCVGRDSITGNVVLDVGDPAAWNIPAAWFRNGVVVSNNPSGVQVDNTSMVIGAGNNDIVVGSDNCLAVGNNNQILADSDHSLAVGQGNTMTNADNSIVVGQKNELTGNRLYVLGFENELTCASAFALGGSNRITGTQNNFAIGYNNNVSGPQKNITIGTSNIISNNAGLGYEQATIIGNNCILSTPNTGNSTQYGMVVIGNNNAQNYPGTTSGQPFRPKIVLAADTGSAQKDALVISEGLNGIASMLHSDALLEHNFADDTAAAAGGVPVGALYHNAGEVRIRIV